MHPMIVPVDSRFPGADLVGQGLADLAKGLLTEEALLVTAAAPRVRRVGLAVPPGPAKARLPRLYELLASSDSVDPHSRYNALVARVVSFARAAERAGAR